MEFEAIIRLPWGWTDYERPGDVTLYKRAVIEGGKGKKVIYAAYASRMGMVAAAALASKMIEAFGPSYLFMTGITAGVKDRCNIGDVIVADPSWDAGSGKHFTSDGQKLFAPSPHQIPMSAALRLQFQRLAADSIQLDTVRQEWPGDVPATSLRILLGPVASGAAVLADASKIEEIERQHRKLLAIEMESYGVYAASLEARAPQPDVAVIKGVSDFADEQKDDRFQRYGAFVSANILRLLLEKYL